MASIPLEDLTTAQLIQRYQELSLRHQQLEVELSELKTKTAEEKAGIEKAHADTVRSLKAQYVALESEHEKLVSLNLKNPLVLAEEFDYDESLGFYRSKKHPERGYYCGSCLPQGTAAQMRKRDRTWVCNVCGKGFSEQDNPGIIWGSQPRVRGRMER